MVLYQCILPPSYPKRDSKGIQTGSSGIPTTLQLSGNTAVGLDDPYATWVFCVTEQLELLGTLFVCGSPILTPTS